MNSFGWFPLSIEMLFDPEFISLTKSEKLVYIYLICEMNGHKANNDDKPYFKADLQLSINLNLSIDTVRKARAKFKRFGWIEYRVGSNISRKGNIATTYLNLKWTSTESSQQFAKTDRFNFYLLLSDNYYRALNVESILLYLYLTFFEMKYKFIKEAHPIGEYIENHKYEFFVKKWELRSVLSLPNEGKALNSLVDKGLLKLENSYTRIQITTLSVYQGPNKCKANLERFEKYQKQSQEKYEETRKNQK